MKHINYFIMLSLATMGCSRKTAQYNDPVPKHDSLTIHSYAVNEDRTINVWTPPSYAQSTDSFTVLYMPDGGVKEDFPHIANTLAELVINKKIEPVILVGIENTQRGRDLTGWSAVKEDEKYNIPMDDGAKNFRAFITGELVPEITRRYRTKNKKGIIGESLAGLFVMETFLLSPESFDFYIAMDPSLWWNDHYLLRNAETYLNNLPDRTTQLWFAGSNATDISIYTKELASILASKQPQQLVWKFVDAPKEKHNTIFRATKEEAIIWALGADR